MKRHCATLAIVSALLVGAVASGSSDPTQEVGGLAHWKQACDRERGSACDRLASLYEADCDEGNAKRCNKLGQFLADGKRVERNELRSARAFGRACGLGNVNGCISGAIQYIIRDIRHNDPRPLLASLEESCGKNKAPSCVLLALAHEKGSGVEQSSAKANALYQKACKLGSAKGCRTAKLGDRAGSAPEPE